MGLGSPFDDAAEVPLGVVAIGLGVVAIVGAVAILNITDMTGIPGEGGVSHPTANQTLHDVSIEVAPGGRLWTWLQPSERFSGEAADVEISPDARYAFVVGLGGYYDANRWLGTYELASLTLDRGAEVWSARWMHPENNGYFPYELAVSPDGARVYLRGSHELLAFEARSGALLWATESEASFPQWASGLVAVSAAGDFIVSLENGRFRNLTAFSTDSGLRLWTAPVEDPSGMRLALSPDGRLAFVTGGRLSAFETAGGRLVWQAFGSPHEVALASVAGSDMIFTTGVGGTTAWDSKNGEPLWTRTVPGTVVATSATRGSLFVSGVDDGSAFVTELDANTGTKRWRHTAAPLDVIACLNVAAMNDLVFVTGLRFELQPGTVSYSLHTTAYGGESGDQLWSSYDRGVEFVGRCALGTDERTIVVAAPGMPMVRGMSVVAYSTGAPIKVSGEDRGPPPRP